MTKSISATVVRHDIGKLCPRFETLLWASRMNTPAGLRLEPADPA